MEFQIDQINLIRSRLLRYREIVRHNGRVRPWETVAGDMILSGIIGLAGDSDTDGAVSAESLRRFCGGKQVPGKVRLAGISKFLNAAGYLDLAEVESADPWKNLDDLARLLTAWIGEQSELCALLEGLWANTQVEMLDQRPFENHLHIIRRTLPSGSTLITEEYRLERPARQRPRSIKLGEGIIVPTGNSKFYVLLRDNLYNKNRIYFPVSVVFRHGIRKMTFLSEISSTEIIEDITDADGYNHYDKLIEPSILFSYQKNS